MFSLIEICCTYVAYRKMLIWGKIGPDFSRDTSKIAKNQKVKKKYFSLQKNRSDPPKKIRSV